MDGSAAGGRTESPVDIATKISMTEYTVRFCEASGGPIVSSFGTDLRADTSDSWFSGIRWLKKLRTLAGE